MVKKERHARAAAEERATQAKAKISEHVPRIEQLEKELHALKGERDQVRHALELLQLRLWWLAVKRGRDINIEDARSLRPLTGGTQGSRMNCGKLLIRS